MLLAAFFTWGMLEGMIYESALPGLEAVSSLFPDGQNARTASTVVQARGQKVLRGEHGPLGCLPPGEVFRPLEPLLLGTSEQALPLLQLPATAYLILSSRLTRSCMTWRRPTV